MAFDPEFVRKLEQFGKVLTVRLLDERGIPTFFRDNEVALLERHVSLARNNSFLLLGPSGCGKTAILHELATRLGSRASEPWLILETSTSTLMAGTQYIGEWQTRVRDMAQLARRCDRVAVYFTDVFNMMGAGRHSKSDENMASYLATYVDGGDVVLIGECTPDTYRQGVDRHPWFKKLFTVFRIDEPSEKDAGGIVRGVAESLAAKVAVECGVSLTFPDNTLTALRQFGKIYFPGTAAPSGAVRLLEHLVHGTTAAIEKGTVRGPEHEIQYDDVVRTLEGFTGIPGLLLDDSQSLKMSKVRQFFESRVIGQSNAVNEVLDLITLIKGGVTDPKKPMGVLFFVGPTGVGKTELAKALAEFIFGHPDRMFRFDMSEFKDFDSYQKLIGSQHGRDDSPLEQGALLSKVRQQPFCVILLDEIEKANANIFDLFLQLFDDGRLTDAQGRTTNFSQSIVIMTSNLGSSLQQDASFGFNQQTDSLRLENKIREAMEAFFRPEFLNRIDRIIQFQQLEPEHVRILAQRELGQVLMRSGIVRRRVHVDVDPGVIDVLAREGFSPMFGARPLKRAVERLALLPVARQLVQMTGEDAKPMLRLLPAGERITIRVIDDPASRKSDALGRGVKVHDPVRGRDDRLKPDQIEQELLGLRTATDMLERQCVDARLEEQKSTLVEQSFRPDFWDDPAQASDARDEIYRIERILDAVDKVRSEVNQVAEQHTSAVRAKDADRLAEVAERIRGVRQHCEVVQYSLQCRDRLDRCDAFVSIAALDESNVVTDDVVGQIADMYCNWARLKGFEARIIHEDLISAKLTREIVLVVEGIAIYGLLAAEEGIHELIYGRTAHSEKQSKFVRVRVLPLVDDRTHALASSDVNIERKKAKGNGRRCKRYKSEVKLVHRPSALTIQGRSDLSVDEAQDLLLELLQAELHRTHYLQPGSNAQDGSRESIIRKYTIRPHAQAKDPRTDISSSLSDLWNGALDPFLYAALPLRHKKAEATPLPTSAAGGS